jgi:hypothetical protein
MGEMRGATTESSLSGIQWLYPPMGSWWRLTGTESVMPVYTSGHARNPRMQRKTNWPSDLGCSGDGWLHVCQSAFKVRRSIQALALRLASSSVVASIKPGSGRVCRTRHRGIGTDFDPNFEVSVLLHRRCC